METKDNEKILTTPHTIEHGVVIKEGTPPGNFVKNETSLLTKPENRVKKTRQTKDATQDARTGIGKLVKQVTRGKTRKVPIKPEHRGVLAEMERNGGKITKAMIAMSYSKRYAERKSLELRESKSFQALLDEYLPEDLVAKRHEELLNKRARRDIRDSKGNIIEYGVDDGPDTQAVTKAIEMAYKLRGAYKPEDAPKQATVTYNLFYKPGVQESVKTFEQQLIRQIYHDVGGDEEEHITDVQATETSGPSDDRGDKESIDGGGETGGGKE